MKTNAPKTYRAVTHEGGRADSHQDALTELERAVSTCLLWENTFYEKGSDIASRIASLCDHVTPEALSALAIKARNDLKLRHVPLFLARQMARLHKGPLVAATLAGVIRRPDETAEFLSLYWKDKKQPISAQVKKGLAVAFRRFTPYQLAKWNRDGAIKLRDVLFLCHAKAKDVEQDALWKSLIAGTLPPADTWEVALSGGADKRETWTRLLSERKLGYVALLMNLRNMAEAKVETALVESAIRDGAAKSWALPFRFISAAKAAPMYAGALSDAMVLALQGKKIAGSTLLVVDVSGSMDATISAKSLLSRWEAAGALAVLFREIAPSCRVFTFSNSLMEVANYRGLPLVQMIGVSQTHGGTHLGKALEALQRLVPDVERLVVVTDEQTHDSIIRPWAPNAYLINVAPYKPGLDRQNVWHRISGWSERVVDWMALQETGRMLGSEEED